MKLFQDVDKNNNFDKHKVNGKYQMKVASDHQERDDMLDFEDHYNDDHDQVEESDGQKEITNMPLNNGDYDSNPYTSKAGYSTKPMHDNSKNQLINKSESNSARKYPDPYADPQNDDHLPSSRKSRNKTSRHINSHESFKNTDNDVMQVKKTKIKDEEAAH